MVLLYMEKHLTHILVGSGPKTQFEGENFTDKVKETKRLKLDFENGINVILTSP